MDGYEEFLLTVRRDINCLSDGDRNVRRNAIVRLEKVLFSSGKTSPEFARRLFQSDLQKPLLRLFGDQTEKCRESSMAIAAKYAEMLTIEELVNALPLLLSALLGRVNRLPFPEPTEEIRLEVLRFLNRLLELCKENMNPFAAEIIEALATALTDTCPDAKKECCEIVSKVSIYFDDERVSRVGQSLVAALLGNLRHQQWKVRRASLLCLGDLLSSEECMLDHMEEALPQLGALLGDRTLGVRQCLGEVLERWLMKGIAFKAPLLSNFDDDSLLGFDQFEYRLVLLLLSVAADEDTEQVAPPALDGLARVAAFKHEARIAQAEKARIKARKMAEAKAAREGKDVTNIQVGEVLAAEQTIKNPEVSAVFDYKAIDDLLPDPFKGGKHTPAALTTTYVLFHLPAILPQILNNLTQWTTDIRSSAARILRVLLVHLNREAAPFLDSILVHLYKASGDDEATVTQVVLQCASLLGAFLDVDFILGLVGKHLGVRPDGGSAPRKGPGVEDIWEEKQRGRQMTRYVQDLDAGVRHFSAASVENRRQVFIILARVLPPAPDTAASRMQVAEVRTALRFLEEGLNSEELLPFVFVASRALLAAGREVCVGEWPRLFDLLLRFRSSEDCDPVIVDETMDRLSELCGRSRRQLYEEHLRTRLGELLMGADMELWDDRGPKRHVLETLLRNAGAAAAEHIGSIVPVLARQSSPEDAAVPARIDILGLLHYLITTEDTALREAVRASAASILEVILIPNCTWRAGQSNNKIRKGGMICIHALLERHLVLPSTLNSVFVDLMPVLKSCLDDSFSPDNRLIAVLVLKCCLSEMQAEISSEQLREVYPEMLKRLDDSNDKIRVAICEALVVFFEALPPRWSRGLYEYILRTLFVHLDDPNPEIQQGIFGALERAIHQDYGAFITEAKVAAAKSSHPRQCEELARLAESLRQASGMDDDATME